VTTKPPVAQRLCWIAEPTTEALIQCWLLDMTNEGVDILVAGPVPNPCTFYFTSDRKISRRCIIQSRVDDRVFLRFAN
jgi:hypothetical protein